MSLRNIILYSFCWLCVAGVALCGLRVLIAPQTWPEPIAIGALVFAAGVFAGSQVRATQ